MGIFHPRIQNLIYITMLNRQAEINNKLIKIQQDLSLSHAGTVWDGALTLAYYFDKTPKIGQHFFKDKKVLELGSGTGIGGFAALCFNPKQLILTDMPEYLNILSQNKQLNQKISQTSVVRVMPLLWGNMDHIQKITQIDTIIASEIAYDVEHIKSFMKTLLFYRKANPALKIIVSYQKYKEEWKNLYLVFMEYLGKDGFREVSWNEMNVDYRDEGIGILYID